MDDGLRQRLSRPSAIKMRAMRLGIVAAITACLVSMAPTAMATPHASDALCGGLTWSRPIPDVVGLTVDPLSNAVQPLTCLYGVKMVGPDGAVLTGITGGGLARIASVSPVPGTLVGPHDPVTVNLVAVDPASTPAYRPCDWVTTAEAGTFLEAAPIGASPRGDEQGSTDIECDYSFNDTPDRSPDRHSVSSQLRLSAHHVVDAGTEYAVSTARDSTPADGIGVTAACTPVSTAVADKPVHRLYVLLPGERLYLATGWGGESCDVLKQFAQAAIPRIGA
jgi:hypothetical protein